MTAVYIPSSWPSARARKATGKRRLQGLGGSDAAIVLGISKWKTSAELWGVKAGVFEDDFAVEQADEGPAYWGRVIEPLLLRQAAIQWGYVVVGMWYDRPAEFLPDGSVKRIRKDDPRLKYLGIVSHPDYPWMLANVDGVCFNGAGILVAIVECKTATIFFARQWGDEGSDEIPKDYLCQVSHYLEVFKGITGRELHAFTPVLVGGQNYTPYVVGYHKDLCVFIREEEKRFWASVQAGEMPPIPRTEDGLKILRRLFPTHEEAPPKDITGMELWIALGDQLKEFAGQEKKLKSDRAAVQVDFQERMKKTARVITPARSWSATWRRAKDKVTVDHKAILKEVLGLVHLNRGRLDVITEKHTTKEEGKRSFRFYAGKDTSTEE